MWGMGVKEGMKGDRKPLAVLNFAVGEASSLSEQPMVFVGLGRKQEGLSRMEQYWKELTFPASCPFSGKQVEMELSPL